MSASRPFLRALVTLVALAGLSLDAAPASSDPVVSAQNAALASQVCAAVPTEALRRTRNGVWLSRSGDIQLIPAYPDFVNGGLTHATPYDYTQEVPLLLFGPGRIAPGVYDRPATLADLAPTLGSILDFPFAAPDGRALDEALIEGAAPPRLVVTLVWDSAGRNVLDSWPSAWPYLASWREKGAWFTDMEADAAPSNTPPSHAMIGTGAVPSSNGFTDEYLRVAGRIVKPNDRGPAYLVQPSLADVYDRAMDNEPIVGAIATLSAHLMMIGHGAMWHGGDRDIAVAREVQDAATGGAESAFWNLTEAMAPWYRMPGYVNDLPPVETYTEELDRRDGALDGMWRGNPIEPLANGFDTPARTPYQMTLVKEIVRREGFGDDRVPDLLFLNFKAIDTIGHIYSANGPEMGDAIEYQDAALRELVAFLNEEVGAGRWVLALTADHGAQMDPVVTGAFMIDIATLEARIEGRFDDGDDTPLLQKLRPTQLWLDPQELADAEATVEEVAAFIGSLPRADLGKNGRTPPVGTESDPAFAAVFPTSLFGAMECLAAEEAE